MINLKIISGGQVGADRAGLDFALENDIEHGGYCPKGRVALDGIIPVRYKLTETNSPLYPERTRKNIELSHATFIFTMTSSLGRGSGLTKTLCKMLGKLYCHVWVEDYGKEGMVNRILEWFESQKDYLGQQRVLVLNIAGTRDLEICPYVHHCLVSTLT